MEEQRHRGRELARAFGTVGAWSFALQQHTAADEQRAVGELEALGYPVLWIPEGFGSKEAFSHAALLLAGSRSIAVATGVANIHARDPMAMANGARALADAYPGRFLLGVGVSHAITVARRGGSYGQPVQQMRAYLEAMDGAAYTAPQPPTPPGRVLAALGPRMLALAAARADGAHSYFVPVEHTVMARRVLGPEPFLAVEQTAVLSRDPGEARRIARDFAGRYLDLPNYANNLRRLGFSDEDLVTGGSDRLIDAVIAWGGIEEIAGRVRSHLDAGADHVCVQFRGADAADLCLPQFAELAALMLRT
jgi:probable F420-dependent oxidoreductase